MDGLSQNGDCIVALQQLKNYFDTFKKQLSRHKTAAYWNANKIKSENTQNELVVLLGKEHYL